MGRGPDLPKGRRRQIRILELLAVGGLVGDRLDHAAGHAQIGSSRGWSGFPVRAVFVVDFALARRLPDSARNEAIRSPIDVPAKNVSCTNGHLLLFLCLLCDSLPLCCDQDV